MVAFTGSNATGKKIMETCAGGLKKVMLELGGNDPAIVMPGSDIEKLAPTIFGKAMFNSGQVCTALKRLFVHSSQYEEMLESLAKKAKDVKLGDGMEQGTQYGPLNNKMQLERVEMLVNDAKSNGARIVAGGERVQPTGSADANFYAPTIIADISDSARIVREEQFGPALPVLKYETIEEAVSRANDTEYGLGASVWGSDINAAAAIGAQLQAGSIWLNNHMGSGMDIDAPFGGIKQSGIGSEAGGKAWVKAFCDEKYLYVPVA
jgi:acyl-CoA reductase-like NAD-dependent aldehyde dehydrogenase